MRNSLTAVTAALMTIVLVGCGGSSKPKLPAQYFSRQPGHGKPCPQLPDGDFLCNANVTSGSRHSQFSVLVDDVTPAAASGVAQMNYSMIATSSRPTRAQALRIATQVAHGHSVLVKRVSCRPASSGWACQYIR